MNKLISVRDFLIVLCYIWSLIQIKILSLFKKLFILLNDDCNETCYTQIVIGIEGPYWTAHQTKIKVGGRVVLLHCNSPTGFPNQRLRTGNFIPFTFTNVTVNEKMHCLRIYKAVYKTLRRFKLRIAPNLYYK